jgi:NAD(P)-dependent dehydrogenase (short-subunit alcohol dehydrogenase family)
MPALERFRNRGTGEGDGIMTEIAGKTVLVTGGNRGIGRALVEQALQRGAQRVYASTRGTWTHPDERVTPLVFDVTDTTAIRAAAGTVDSLDILVNNAGIALYDDLTDRSVLERQLAVNLFGPYEVIQAFLPQLSRSHGTIVNNLSLNALAPLPVIPAYSISKAAAFNLTQALRSLLSARGIRVHAVLTGPTDTDMTKGFNVPKATSRTVAQAIFGGVERDEQDIFPDPLAEKVAGAWRDGVAKTLEEQFAALAAAAAAAA